MKKQFLNYGKPTKMTLSKIATANEIISEYMDMGLTLTLRQLYYQFVARGYIENSERSYKNIGSMMNNGRLWGLVDWDAMEDRTRNLSRVSTWEKPSDILITAARAYRENPWESQRVYAEVWIEKEALTGVVQRPCDEWRVPHFACRGYVSQSEMYSAGQRLIEKTAGRDATAIIYYLGDHDPSGINMTEDIKKRLGMFTSRNASDIEVRRIALNMDQVDELNPPPNPAKLTDSRANEYISRFGNESWELDALSPEYIGELIETNLSRIIDKPKWVKAISHETKNKKRIKQIVDDLKEKGGTK